MSGSSHGSIAAREQYLSRIRRLPAEVEYGLVTEIEAEGIRDYLAKAIVGETYAGPMDIRRYNRVAIKLVSANGFLKRLGMRVRG